ncbi:hypothetical protein PUN4_270073 [Paraburkholderia unamae]|nr:hypothetical protein PUN4_270073 [Paraburkholderia unamae]
MWKLWVPDQLNTSHRAHVFARLIQTLSRAPSQERIVRIRLVTARHACQRPYLCYDSRVM